MRSKSSLFILSIAALAVALALGGCSTAPSVRVDSLQSGQPSVITTDAAARAIVILPKPDGKGMAVCAEPSPDVAFATVAKMIAEIKVQNPNIDAKTQIEFQTAVVELSKRTSTIMFLRESLYRTCEAGINQNLSSDQVMKLYEMAMQAALKLADAELVKNKADLAKNLRNPQVRGLFNQMTDGK